MPLTAPATTRDLDDRQLNAYGVEFQNVNLSGKNARGILRKLEKKVEAFRQLLYTRDYPVMDILRDADALEHRIATQREHLPKKVAVAPPSAVPPASAQAGAVAPIAPPQ